MARNTHTNTGPRLGLEVQAAALCQRLGLLKQTVHCLVCSALPFSSCYAIVTKRYRDTFLRSKETDWLIDWLIDCLIDWLIDWLLDCLIVWLIDWSIAWLMDLVWFVLLYLIGIGLDLSTTTYFSWFTSLCRWTLVEAIRWWTLIQACWTKHNGCHPQRASLASRFDRDADLVLRSFTWKPMRRCHLLQGGARNTFFLTIYVWCLHQCFFFKGGNASSWLPSQRILKISNHDTWCNFWNTFVVCFQGG